MIPLVWPPSWAWSDGKRKTPFLFLNMWEVALPGKVGLQEKKGVFLSFMQGSSYESGLALGSKLIAGGLQVHLGAWGLLKQCLRGREVALREGKTFQEEQFDRTHQCSHLIKKMYMGALNTNKIKLTSNIQ